MERVIQRKVLSERWRESNKNNWQWKKGIHYFLPNKLILKPDYLPRRRNLKSELKSFEKVLKSFLILILPSLSLFQSQRSHQHIEENEKMVHGKTEILVERRIKIYEYLSTTYGREMSLEDTVS